VRVTLRGRLGNNLFQYAIARIIAEQHGFSLACAQMPLSPEQVGRHLILTGPSTLGELTAYFPNAPLRIDGFAGASPVEHTS